MWLVPATGHPIKQSLLMRPSSSGYRRHHNHRLFYHWGISTTLTSAGKVAWQAACNPGDSWNALRITFRVNIDGPTRRNGILDLLLSSASEMVDDIRTGNCLGSSDHAMLEFTFLKDIGQRVKSGYQDAKF